MNKVSVVVPSYNGGKFLNDLIDNVLSQTLEEFELIIVIDASEDNSLEIVTKRQSEDSRIILLANTVRRGASECRNQAINRCNSEYIAFMDHDDLWHPKKLERQVEFMEKDQSLVGVLCNYIICKDKSFNFKALGAVKHKNTSRMFEDWLNFKGEGPALASTLMLRNSGTIIYFNEELRALYDLEYFYDVSKKGKIGYCIDYLMLYIQHDEQMHRNPRSVMEIGNLTHLSEKERNRLKSKASVYSKLLGKDLQNILRLPRDFRTRDFFTVTQILFGVLKRRLFRKLRMLIDYREIADLILIARR